MLGILAHSLGVATRKDVTTKRDEPRNTRAMPEKVRFQAPKDWGK